MSHLKIEAKDLDIILKRISTDSGFENGILKIKGFELSLSGASVTNQLQFQDKKMKVALKPIQLDSSGLSIDVSLSVIPAE